MAMLAGLIQIACIVGLLCGLYLAVTYADPGDLFESHRKLQPPHFAYDPLIADAFASTQPAKAERQLALQACLPHPCSFPLRKQRIA
jgi:hypothetical protein